MQLQVFRALGGLAMAGWVACSGVASLGQTAGAPPIAIRAEAFVGRPFGVGRVELDLPPELRPEPLGLAGLGLSEKDGRVLYPAVQRRPAGEVLKALSAQAPAIGGRLGLVLDQAAGVAGLVGDILHRAPKVTVFFLFHGDAPLEIAIQSRRTDAIVLRPVHDAAGHQRLLAAWWGEYSAPPSILQRGADYPLLVENYLRSMLARRLNLPLPRLAPDRSWQGRLRESFELGVGNESIRLAIQRDRFLDTPALREAADQPLPAPIAPPEPDVPDLPDAVEVEPLAQRVPAECFYVRFGSFSNFLWLQDLLAQWGGDLQNLVDLRGLDQGVRARIERQLALESTVLARLLGETIVADVAIVGTDFFFTQGGSYGILFQARNNALLQADLGRQRTQRVAKKDGTTQTKVAIEGREATLLASADGSVRSFYVADGDYHFVTTSQTLARRFLETRSGKGALGATRAFRHARNVMPTSRKDTIFVYLSDPFFRNFTSPKYRIETIRRTQALADLELVELAQLASATEGTPGETIEQLVAGGFLPPDFGPRPDGSQTLLENGQARDSLRGQRGRFVPVADVAVVGASPSEAAAYQEFADFYAAHWERLDPILVGIRRHAASENREWILVDLRMTPFARRNYEMLRQRVGPPDKQRLAPIAHDMIALEAVLPRQRVFGGLWGIGNPAAATQPDGAYGLVRNLLVGYLGSTGEPGLVLGFLNARVTSATNAEGYAVSPGGLWRRRIGEFTVFSFQPDLLATVTSQLKFEQAERPAQVRLRVLDLSHARTKPYLNNLAYLRTRSTSLGNLRLMHALAQQLHVPAPDCKAAAEALLDARLIDPLGGQYVYRPEGGSGGAWTTSALEGEAGRNAVGPGAPEGYEAPPLRWFRGLNLDALVAPEGLSVHAEVLMKQR